MKYIYYTIFIIAILFLFMFVGEVLGEETLSGKLIVDFPKEEAVYVESHDFSAEYGTVKTTATVLPTECNSSKCGACLCLKQPSECIDLCRAIAITY